MPYPISALFAATAQDVPPGHFYLKEGQWYLAVTGQRQAEGSSAVCLTGDATGWLQHLPDGSALYVGGAFSVEPHVADLSGSVAAEDAHWNGALLLGTRPNLYAQFGNGDRLFTLDGEASRGEGVSASRRRFLSWEAWLKDERNQIVGNQPLFTVNAIGKIVRR